jgi:hypothetical protein
MKTQYRFGLGILSAPKIVQWLAVAALGFVLASYAVAADSPTLAVGDAVPGFAAKDQFGKDFKFEPGLHFLLLGFDMGASKAANLKLEKLGAGWLESKHAAYVLDIHTMPGIARVFAFPKMRKYPQRIILGDDEKMLAPFPRQDGRITVLVLTPAAKIQEIRYWNPSTQDAGDALP